MGREIERKFMLPERPLWLERCDAVEIEQCYLALDGPTEVRLRRSGDATLTVKLGRGGSREEVELGLAPEVAESLWPAGSARTLRKRRYLVPLDDGLRAEVDEYAGGLEGLRVAEVEFLTESQAQGFDPPDWFGEEVTGDDRYSNQALATEGMPKRKRGGPSRSYRLKRKESVADGVRRIAAGRTAQALERLEGTGPGEDGYAEAVHGARKDMKKLRALLRLARGALGESVYREENERFRDAGRQLSASRDAQVKLETLDGLAGGAAIPGDAIALWRAELERGLGEGGDEGERLAAAVAAIEAGQARIDAWPLDGDSWKLLEPGLRRAYGRGRRAMRAARRDGDADAFHDWRKRAKDLWYQLELLAKAWPEGLRATADEAHRLSEALGDHHDLAILAEDLDSRRIEAGREEVLRTAIAARQEELAGEAFALGERLYAEKPGAYRRRLRAYWRAWR